MLRYNYYGVLIKLPFNFSSLSEAFAEIIPKCYLLLFWERPITRWFYYYPFPAAARENKSKGYSNISIGSGINSLIWVAIHVLPICSALCRWIRWRNLSYRWWWQVVGGGRNSWMNHRHKWPTGSTYVLPWFSAKIDSPRSLAHLPIYRISTLYATMCRDAHC